MQQAQLQQLVQRVSQTVFRQPFLHEARFNTRLRTTGGRYLLRTHDLEFNPAFVDDEAIFLGIIKHELVHYHLHLRGQGYRHRDADFKQLLAQVEGLRFAPRDMTPKRYWVYACANGHEFFRQRRMQTQRYVCKQCQGRIRLIGETTR
jgi:SprT-like protein